MSAVRNIRMLTRYNRWANTMLVEAIFKLPTEEFTKKRAAAFGGMGFALAHIDIVDRIWQGHLLGMDHGFKTRRAETHDSLEILAMKLRDMDDWYIGYADTMNEGFLNEAIHFHFVDGGTGVMTRGDVLIHVCNHKAFHRGHVGDMFYQSGFQPPSIDLPVFIRDAFSESALG